MGWLYEVLSQQWKIKVPKSMSTMQGYTDCIMNWNYLENIHIYCSISQCKLKKKRQHKLKYLLIYVALNTNCHVRVSEWIFTL